MSWNITHQCRFQSRTKQQYCVNISIQSDTGQAVKQLQGSENPFTTSEASGDDIFMPIRQQAGYLRILDNTGGALVEELIPENNTQKMVTLVNLTTGKTEWIGFLAAEVFTQPWDNDLTELEFPLKSALACLEDVQIQAGQGGTHRMAYLIWNAFSELFQNEVPFTELYLLEDTATVGTPFFVQVNFERFFDRSTIINDNTRTTIKVGQSFCDALSAMCRIFGIMLRQQGTTLVLSQYDDGSGNLVAAGSITWEKLEQIATTSTGEDDLQYIGGIETTDMLGIADFRSNKNSLTFIQGGKNAIVTLDLGNIQGDEILQMPESSTSGQESVDKRYLAINGEYDAGGIYVDTDDPLKLKREIGISFSGGYEGESFSWIPRVGNTGETFKIYSGVVFKNSGNSVSVKRTHNASPWVEETDVKKLLDRCFFRGSTGQEVFYSYAQWNALYTGAVPGRYGKNNEVLKNAILLVQDVYCAGDTPDIGSAVLKDCYSIQNSEMVEMRNCYLHIDFSIPLTIYTIISELEASMTIGSGDLTFALKNNGSAYVSEQSNLLKAPTASESITEGITQQFYCTLHIWNDNQHLYWNGSSWQTDWAWTYITVEKGTIKSNYNSSMPIDSTGGILAYVENFTGYVGLAIYNCCNSPQYMEMQVSNVEDLKTAMPVFPFQKILTDLVIDLIYPRDNTVSDDTSNVYRKSIITSGFSEDKEIALELGTNNNNRASMALLKNNAGTGYLTSISYKWSTGVNYSERPEMHLLNRMVEYYKTMRRTMEAKIATGIDLFRQRFSYNGRKYMAIDKKHDWEREEQEVKFIEVT